MEMARLEEITGQVEKLIDDYTFDFQAKVLTLALARLPKREENYELSILRDSALGVLAQAVADSGLSFQEQTQVFNKMRAEFSSANGGQDAHS